MRAREFISETEHKKAKIPQRFQQPSTGLDVYLDGQRINSDYTQYRLGLALACADGTNSLDIDPASWYGKMKTVHPYTEKEQAMIKQAFKAVDADYKDLNGEVKSRELESTYTKSPVNDWRKNK